MNYNISEQALSFHEVLPWQGQIPPVEVQPDGSVIIKITASQAELVTFSVDDKEYSCIRRENGVWEGIFPYRTGHHYVQIKMDGMEILSPLLPIGYGYSRPYNYIELPQDDFYQLKNVPHGSVRNEYFYSEITGGWERCVIYTPAEYEEEKGKIFPVLYLQHGHGENEVSWTTAGKVNFILDNLTAEKKIVPFVVVMCNGMVQRVDEKGKRIVDFKLLEEQLVKECIPFAEKKFRIGKKRELRAMAGLSMGSLQTSITGFCHPELFSALGLFSGFVTDIIQGTSLDMVERGKSNNEHLRILENAKRFTELFPVFFRSMGDQDPFWECFVQDDKLLEEKGIHQIRKVYRGAHDWNVWRKSFLDFAQMLFRQGCKEGVETKRWDE